MRRAFILIPLLATLLALGGCFSEVDHNLRIEDKLTQAHKDLLIGSCSLANLLEKTGGITADMECQDLIMGTLSSYISVDPLFTQPGDLKRRMALAIHTLAFYPLLVPESGNIFENPGLAVPDFLSQFEYYADRGGALPDDYVNWELLNFVFARINKISFRASNSGMAPLSAGYDPKALELTIYGPFLHGPWQEKPVTILHEIFHERFPRHAVCVAPYLVNQKQAKDNCDDFVSQGSYSVNVFYPVMLSHGLAFFFGGQVPENQKLGDELEGLQQNAAYKSCIALEYMINYPPAPFGAGKRQPLAATKENCSVRAKEFVKTLKINKY